MAAKRKFIVRRNVPFKKAQGNQGTGGNVYDPQNQNTEQSDSNSGSGPTLPTFSPGSYGPWSQQATGNAISNQQDQIRNDVTHETLNRQIRENQRIVDESNKPKKTPEQEAAEQAIQSYNENKDKEEDEIGESPEERQGKDTPEAESIEQEPTDIRDQRAQQEAEEQRRQQALDKARITKEVQEKWAKKEASDKRIARAMTGLRLAGDIADRAVGAVQSLTKLGSAFLQNPFTSPMGSAQQIFNTTVVDAGAAIVGLGDDIGKLWGIKDGIKDPKDIAGTYKGAKYYDEMAQVDTVQALFAKDLDDMATEAFGDKYTGNNFGELISNAIKEGNIEVIDKLSKKLRDTYDGEEGMELRRQINQEEMDRNNDGIPADKKFKASAKAKAFDAIYRRYLGGLTNASETIGANARKDEVAARQAQTNLARDRRNAERARKDAERAARIKDDEDRRNFLMGRGELGRSVAVIEDIVGRDAVEMGDLDTDGLPRMRPALEDNIIRTLSNKKDTGGTLNEDEVRLLNALTTRRNTRRQERADRDQETADRRAERARRAADKAQQIADDKARTDYLMQQGPWGRAIVIAERIKGRKNVVNMTELDEDGLPKMRESLENDIITALSNKSVTEALDKDEIELLDALKTRQENRRAALQEEVERNGGADAYIEKLLKNNPDRKLGGSLSPETNKKIMNIAMMQMDRIRADYIDSGGNKGDWDTVKYTDPEYIKFRSFAESAKSAHDTYESMKYINKIRGASSQEKEAMGSNITRLRKKVAKYWGPNSKVDWSDPKVQQEAEKALKKLSDAKKSLRKRSYMSRRRKK